MPEDTKPGSELRVVRGGKVAPLIQAGVSPQTLERVLEHLQKRDKLFDYNVPEEWREPTKEGLQEYLVEVYSQRKFEITGEEAVKKYLKVYDFVTINTGKPHFEYISYVGEGTRGIIKSVDHSKKFPITIQWESCDKFPKEQVIDSNGKGLTLFKGTFRKREITDPLEVLAEAKPGRLVEKAKTEFKYSYYLPAGIVGIVNEIDNSHKFPVNILFGNTEGYIPSKDGIINCAYWGLNIYRENNFDIRKLIKESGS